MSVAKKRKVDSEQHTVKEEWTLKYFLIEHGSKPMCLICNEVLAVNKEFNLKRHFETKRKKFDELKGQLRIDKVVYCSYIHSLTTLFFKFLFIGCFFKEMAQ